MLRTIFQKIFSVFGYKIIKKINMYSFDTIYKKEIKESPIIFDVGANRGQSIERFRRNFPNCVIHCFEPLEQEFEILKKKYSDDKNIHLNNFALGEKEEFKIFYTTVKSENSSFNKLNLNTNWIKIRSKQYKTNQDKFILDEKNVKIKKLDDYCADYSINSIDILKLDTSGFEHKILLGAKNMIKQNSIHAIETEFMFDNVYETKTSFYEFEKEIVNDNFRIYAIDHIKGFKSIYEYMFGVYALYFNERYKNKK